MKYQFKNITNLEEIGNKIYGDNENIVYYYNDYSFRVWRTKNDINGNPLYKLDIAKKGINVVNELKGLVKRVNKNKYGLIQSYVISDTLKYIFKELDKKEL